MKIKIVTLKLNKEFKHAYYQGKFKAHPFLVTYLVKNRNRLPRIGITASKKIGNAVKRNRARRIIKQAYREILSEGRLNFSGYDIVFVARKDTLLKKTSDIKKVMNKHISLLLGR